jgi:hypothetical protein
MLGDESQKFAHEKTKRINQAYRVLHQLLAKEEGRR